MRTHAELDLIQRYNAVAARWGQPPRRVTAAARREAALFLAWAEREKVDPERYIRARMEALGGKARVPLKTMPSAKFLDSFRRFGDARQAAAQGQERVAVQTVPAARAEILHEAMRRVLTGTRLCTRDPMTGGYSATSPTCAACLLRRECAGRTRVWS